MAHEQQRGFCRDVLRAFNMASNVKVLDIGSLDVNGNNRTLFTAPFEYTGVDVAPGPNVDVVSLGHEFTGGPYDVVMSTEALEHDPHWTETLENMYALTRIGGLVLFTCAGVGRLEHGTAREKPEDNPLAVKLWPDWYRNMRVEDISFVYNDEMFITMGIVKAGVDLRFYGVKKEGDKW